MTREILTNYDKFIKSLNEQVSNISVKCEIRNFGDWQPHLYIKYEDMGAEEAVIRQFIADYNEANNTIYGNIYNLMENAYIEGKKQNFGNQYYIYPLSPEYTALRNRLFAIAEEIRACGFTIKNNDIRNNRYRPEIEISIWNDAIDCARDYQYQLHAMDFELENEFEKRMERAYEDMIVRNSWS